jgi:hypothetical protein
MVSSFEFQSWILFTTIPATDVQECLFKQRRQGDSAREQRDVNRQRRSQRVRDAGAANERSGTPGAWASAARRERGVTGANA